MRCLAVLKNNLRTSYVADIELFSLVDFLTTQFLFNTGVLNLTDSLSLPPPARQLGHGEAAGRQLRRRRQRPLARRLHAAPPRLPVRTPGQAGRQAHSESSNPIIVTRSEEGLGLL